MTGAVTVYTPVRGRGTGGFVKWRTAAHYSPAASGRPPGNSAANRSVARAKATASSRRRGPPHAALRIGRIVFEHGRRQRQLHTVEPQSGPLVAGMDGGFGIQPTLAQLRARIALLEQRLQAPPMERDRKRPRHPFVAQQQRERLCRIAVGAQ